MADRCEITELPTDMCAHCRGLNGADQEGTIGPWITAAYEGNCSDCSEMIEPGDRIRADGEGGWLCEECGDV